MAATVNVQEANGAGPSYTTVTNSRFKTADDATQDNSDPTKILGSVNYSYWKSLTLEFTGTFGSIDNIRLYSDGTIVWTLGTTGEVSIGAKDSGDFGCPIVSYDQATGPAAGEGYWIGDDTNGHTYHKDDTNDTDDITGFTSGAPCDIDTGTTYSSPGDRCNFAVLQIVVDTDATQGYQAVETLTWLYDEV